MRKTIFKVGDKVKSKGSGQYGFGKINGSYFSVKKGDILTISEVKEEGRVYGFKEDENEGGRAHWIRVDINFELANTNWKRRLEWPAYLNSNQATKLD